MEELITHYPSTLVDGNQAEPYFKKMEGTLRNADATGWMHQPIFESFFQSLGYYYVELVIEAFSIYLNVVIIKESLFSFTYIYNVLKITVSLFVIAYFPSRIKEEVLLYSILRI